MSIVENPPNGAAAGRTGCTKLGFMSFPSIILITTSASASTDQQVRATVHAANTQLSPGELGQPPTRRR